jgi:hypothetical protein
VLRAVLQLVGRLVADLALLAAGKQAVGWLLGKVLVGELASRNQFPQKSHLKFQPLRGAKKRKNRAR